MNLSHTDYIFNNHAPTWLKISEHCNKTLRYIKNNECQCKYADITGNCIFSKEYLPVFPKYWTAQNIENRLGEIDNILLTLKEQLIYEK